MEKFSIATVKVVIKDALEILKLNKEMIHKVALDEKATIWALGILAAPFVVSTVLGMFQRQGTEFIGLQMKFYLIPIIAICCAIFLMSFVAQRFFKATGDHFAFFRVIGFAGVVTWVSVVPILLSTLTLILYPFDVFNVLYGFAGLWMLFVSYNVLISYYKLNQQNAIITSLIGVISVWILQYYVLGLWIGRYYVVPYL